MKEILAIQKKNYNEKITTGEIFCFEADGIYNYAGLYVIKTP
jgi:hypothetical protein